VFEDATEDFPKKKEKGGRGSLLKEHKKRGIKALGGASL